MIKRIKEKIKKIEGTGDELLWARIWDDTCKGIDWITDLPSISPGRWAVGYNYIYVMTRVLDSIRPHSVLDLGLGISSSLISCYFKFFDYEDGLHTIIEQDENWVKFYTQINKLPDTSEIHVCECVEKSYKDCKIYAYKDFANVVKNKKYSVISIDGPWGSDRYSRRDIIEVLPDILEDSFVIILDDTNRRGEKDTIKEIEQILRLNNIEFVNGWYSGLTDCNLICSKSLRFLQTL